MVDATVYKCFISKGRSDDDSLIIQPRPVCLRNQKSNYLHTGRITNTEQ